MPSPMDRLLNTKAVTNKIIHTQLIDMYEAEIARLEADIVDRLKRKSLGKLWGGSAHNDVYIAMLNESMEKLKKQTRKLTGRALDAFDNKFNTEQIKFAEPWLIANLKAVPPAIKIKVPNIEENWRTLMRRGTLVETKLRQGAYKKGGLNSLHARKFEETAVFLRQALVAGDPIGVVFNGLERHVWNVDIASTGTDPKALKWIKRLIRSEYQFAHNSNRQDVFKGDPNVIGYHIELDPDHCPICEDAYGKRDFLYAEDGRLEPPSESHPNCFCTITGPIWKPLKDIRPYTRPN